MSAGSAMLPFLTLAAFLLATSTSACDNTLDLSQRVTLADVVVTGIAKSSDDLTADIQVIQVLRDVKSLLSTDTKSVTIRGLDNSEICDNKLVVNLVKIFPLSVRNGQFYLNSSLIDVSIDNLNVIRQSAKDQNDLCREFVCDEGKICQVSQITKQAECVCEACSESKEYKPVCATNNVVYPNKCQMQFAACKTDSKINLKKEGFCDDDPCDGVQCDFGAKCVVSTGSKTTSCQCQSICPRIDAPICTTDGRNFSNECELNKFTCENQVHVRTQYNSACDPCERMTCPENTKCKVNEKTRQATCSCGEKCLAEEKTVCANNGYDYPNECELQRHSCLASRTLSSVAPHSCRELETDPCSLTTCSNFAECVRSETNPNVAECSCPFVCEPILKPVCGRDSRDSSLVQFDNECSLRLTSCSEQRSLTLIYHGTCDQIEELGKDFISQCHDLKCEVGYECSLDSANEPTCVCARSCSGFGYNPVCASDGRTYTNECEFKRSVCLNRRNDVKKISNEACPNACGGYECKNYGECRTNVFSQKAECFCPSKCLAEDVMSGRVCGDDGDSYQNVCHLKRTSCQTGTHISISYYGLCFEKDKCEHKNCHKNAICHKGECQCESCDYVSKETVCGSDGVSYDNECEMKRRACEKNLDTSLRHYGTCVSSVNEKTLLEESKNSSQKLLWKCAEKCLHGSCFLVDSIWQCLCPQCENEPQINTLCGEDNKTYASECHLKQAMCMQQEDIGILHLGSCDSVSECPVNSEIIREQKGIGFKTCSGDHECRFSSYCYEGNCCFYKSSTLNCSSTVYGCCADGVTFALGNDRQGCPENCLCNELGSYGNRCDGLRQCICRKGVTGKRCDRCISGFWNFTRMKDLPYLGCQECNCNVNGSSRQDCDQTTGDCLCKSGVFGRKCNLCPLGMQLSPLGCVSQNEAAKTEFYASCDGVKCQNHATCVQRGPYARCECPVSCPKESETTPVVCGSDGKTYIHECDMVVQGCNRGHSLTVKSYGPCQNPSSSYDVIGGAMQTSAGVNKPQSDSYFSEDECEHMSCKHGGFCYQHQVSEEPQCLCPIGFAGEKCEQQLDIKIPKFSGNSFIQFSKSHLNTQNSSLKLYIKPSFETGVLLYVGPAIFLQGIKTEKFLLLFLEKGVVKAKFNFGHELHILTINLKVEPQSWFVVELQFQHNVAELLVASHPGEISNAPSVFTSKLPVTPGGFSEDLSVGGVPLKYRESLLKELGVSEGFHGCLTKVHVSGAELDTSYPDSTTLIGGYGIQTCDFNPCYENPCQNDGSCIVEDSFNFWCVCKIGYEGDTCNYLQDPCSLEPCHNGGTCQVVSKGYKCLCPLGTKGEKCERVMKMNKREVFMPSFNMNSYLRTVSGAVKESKDFEIDLWIYTRKLRGLLFVAIKNSDFMIVELVDHKLHFHWKVASEEGVLTVSDKFHSHTWYQISIRRPKNYFTIHIPSLGTFSKFSTSKVDGEFFSEPFYVGGFPDLSKLDATSSTHGFRGIIQKLKVNGEILIGNQTANEISSHFDRYFNVIGWRNHKCYERRPACQKHEVCQPNLESFSCSCADEQCYSKKKENKDNKEQMDSKITPIKFDGMKSYVIYNSVTERITSQSQSSYEFSFRTGSYNGMILWSKEDSLVDYFTVGLWNGLLHVKIELGAGVTQLFSINALNDQKWHEVTIQRQQEWILLKVDQNPVVKSQLYKGASKLDTNGLIWVGGVPGKKGATVTPFHFDDATLSNFVGCLASLSIDGKPVDFYTNTLEKRSIEKCT